MKARDWIAIKKPGEDFYTWMDRATIREREPGEVIEGPLITSVNYAPSGRLAQREDGEVAEIWEPIHAT